jgi:hypothetical protein
MPPCDLKARKSWTSSRIMRHAVCIILILCCWVMLLGLKISYTSRQELRRGDDAAQRGAYQEAITHYERAIKWYTPWSASVQQAVERLWAVGAAAEQRAEWSLALEAYRSLRASLYSVQSLYLPYQEWIPKSEANIARLMAQTSGAGSQDVEQLAQHTTRFTQMLQRDTTPQRGWSLLAVGGFLAWVGGTIGFLWRVFPSGQIQRWQAAVGWGCVVIIAFTVWIIGLLFA